MKLVKNFLFVLVAISMAACGNQSTQEHDHDHNHDHDHDHESTEVNDGVHFGEEITEEGAVSFDELMTALEGKESIEDVKVVATVGEVCQTKGCWMNISDGSDEKIFVQFKDYGFFMPKDLTDSKVALQGRAYYDVTSVEDLKHFAEDEGLSEEEIAAITEPKKELKFMASGVKVLDRSEPVVEEDTKM